MKRMILSLVLICGIYNSVNAQREVIGIISSVNGKVFTVECETTNAFPSATDTCNVSKDISGSKNPFGINITSGWMAVGDAFFLNCKGNKASFKVIRETSDIVINGKKQEHLVKGKKLKITWK